MHRNDSNVVIVRLQYLFVHAILDPAEHGGISAQ